MSESAAGFGGIAYERDYLFCHKCGAETTRRERIVGYRGETGKPRIEVLRRCPNAPQVFNSIAGHTDQWTYQLAPRPIQRLPPPPDPRLRDRIGPK